MSLFDKTTKPAVTRTTEREQKPAEFFVNLGFRKTYGDQERFVNIPLIITADNIQAGIERVNKSAGANSPEEWLEFTEDRVMLGEDLMKLFSEIPVGHQIVNKEIPDDHELSYFQGLEVQFVHRDVNKETVKHEPKDRKARRAGFGK